MVIANADDYLRALQALLPPGAAWTRSENALMTGLLRGWSQEFARIDAAASALLEEADPRTTFALLPDFERDLALPTHCMSGVSQSVAQRRAAVLAKLTSTGGQSIPYFIQLAANIGFAITITEFSEHAIDDDVDSLLYDSAWPFAWQVNSALNTIGTMGIDDDADQSLAWWGNQLLECVISDLAPEHTTVIFSYS